MPLTLPMVAFWRTDTTTARDGVAERVGRQALVSGVKLPVGALAATQMAVTPEADTISRGNAVCVFALPQ